MQGTNLISGDQYLTYLKQMYHPYFDLEENKEVGSNTFDLYGIYHLKNEKYFASKAIKIWGYTQYEHCLIRKNTKLNSDSLPQEKYLDQVVDQLVEVHREHKQTYISWIEVVEDGVDQELVYEINNFSYSQTFAFGFRGWCDLRLIVVDLKNNKVYANKKGKEVKDNYRPQRFIRQKTS